MIKETVDIVEELISQLDIVVEFKSVVDNGDNTYTIEPDVLENFDALNKSIAECTPEWAAKITGVSAADIEEALLLAYAGGRITTYKTDVDQYYVILEVLKEYQHTPDNLAQIYIRSLTTGELVPLGAVAEWEETVGPQNVPHSDQINSVTISFNLRDNMPVGTATKALQQAADKI